MSNSTIANVAEDKGLFWGCWIALVTTSFAFIARIFTQGEWGKELNLTQTQVGEIIGAGFWPFFISIILFSLVMDKIGYKVAMTIGFVFHIVSIILTYTSNSYGTLYLATFLNALGNGTVEAYINPVVATIYSKEKSRWLNYLHGGWSGGFVVAGLLLIIAMPTAAWRIKLLLPAIPAVIYFVMLIGKKFPIGESAAAGVPFRQTLGEVGGIGFFVMGSMMFAEIFRSTHLIEATPDSPYKPLIYGIVAGVVLGVAMAVYTKSFVGRPMFLLLLLLMIPLATTELGVDSWIPPLMEPTMGENAKWLFVYTAAIMTIMRFLAGPILHALSPLGVLAVAALGAAIALFGLSSMTGAAAIFLCGTLYGASKAFFWPTTLGVVSEQFPRGGAMTLNGISGTGLLGVGILGAMFLGNLQDKTVDKELLATNPGVHAKVTESRTGLLGRYNAVTPDKLATLSAEEKAVVTGVQGGATKVALKTAAVLPMIMFGTYVLLLLYFKSRGGYKPVDINQAQAEAAARAHS